MTDEMKRIVFELRECGNYRIAPMELKAANLIERLSAELDNERAKAKELHNTLQDVMRDANRMHEELEAAKRDIYELCNDEDCFRYCNYCKYQESDGQCFHECKIFDPSFGWEWRGLCAKNGGELSAWRDRA